jgi:hypothetical protein
MNTQRKEISREEYERLKRAKAPSIKLTMEAKYFMEINTDCDLMRSKKTKVMKKRLRGPHSILKLSTVHKDIVVGHKLTKPIKAVYLTCTGFLKEDNEYLSKHLTGAVSKALNIEKAS